MYAEDGSIHLNMLRCPVTQDKQLFRKDSRVSEEARVSLVGGNWKDKTAEKKGDKLRRMDF